MSELANLLQVYVDEILNGADIDLIPTVFASNFRDHDPLQVAGVLQPAGPIGSLHDLYAQVRILADPNIDINFTLEECIDSDDGRIAYRLFGEGSIPLSDDSVQSPGNPKPRSVKKLSVSGARLYFESGPLQGASMLGNQLHITYRTVGIFHGRSGQFTERWGGIQIE